jgi:uncharacterized protein Yka (UPF0111/DUF47 family)
MFSLQRLLGKEDKFFDLLEASAREALHSIQALQKLFAKLDANGNLQQIASVRRKEKAIHRQISEALCTTFVTALEREDIEALSIALYKIPKTAEKIAERVLMVPQFVHRVDFSRQITSLERAAGTILEMLQQLRKGGNLERVTAQNEILQEIEGEADKLVLAQLKDVYCGKFEQGKIVFLKDLYELFEKVADRCRDAGNVMMQIVLKNS